MLERTSATGDKFVVEGIKLGMTGLFLFSFFSCFLAEFNVREVKDVVEFVSDLDSSSVRFNVLVDGFADLHKKLYYILRTQSWVRAVESSDFCITSGSLCGENADNTHFEFGSCLYSFCLRLEFCKC